MVERDTSAPDWKTDYELALKQHDDYIEALKKCSVEITVLGADERYPGFLLCRRSAVITENARHYNPGAASRSNEKNEIIGAVKNSSRR